MNINDNSHSFLDAEANYDFAHISERKDQIVGGFLSLGNKDGLRSEEGGAFETGFRFVRYTLRKFWHEKSYSFQDYSDIFRSTIQSFSVEAQTTPARAICDTTSSGWYKHAVCRIVGNLSEDLHPEGPYYEVLINSARTGPYNTHSYPIQTTILPDRNSAKNRGDLLREIKRQDESIAYPVYYESRLLGPKDYKKNNQVCLSAHTNRMLEALSFLNSRRMKAQTVGNCWIKQPKRAVLVSLFMECIANRPELNQQQAWKLSHRFYTKWKAFARQEIAELINSGGISLDLKRVAEEKIAQLEKA